MEYVKKDIPLWQVTTWDKKFNNVAKEWQPKTIKYNYLLSDELDALRVDDGNVVILYTGKDSGFTTEELAGENLSEGEIVSIPWGGIPTVKYCKGKFVTGDNRIATSNDTEELTNKYLYYFMKGNIQKIASFYRGASLKHPCMKDILKMTISYPTVEVQYQICKQFESLENIIKERKLELELLDNLIKARFVEMFGDPRTNSKDWNIKTFDELSYIITDGEHATPRRTMKGIYLLSARNILNHSLQLKDVDYIDQEEYDRISKRVVPREGDVLISCSGTIGRCCSVPVDIKFQMVRSAALIRFKEEINPIFAEYMITSDYLQNQINSSKTASSQANLFQGKIKSLKGFVPPIELQNQFADFVHQVDKSKVASDKQLKNIAILLVICSIIYTNLNGNMGRIPYDN